SHKSGDEQHSMLNGDSWGDGRKPSCVMMSQVSLNRLAVFDDLITDTACRPEGSTEGESRGKGRDLLHLRVVMMVMACRMHPRVMMIRASRGVQRATHKHQSRRED